MKINHSYKLLNKAKDKLDRRQHSKEENEFRIVYGVYPTENQLKEYLRWKESQKSDLHSPICT